MSLAPLEDLFTTKLQYELASIRTQEEAKYILSEDAVHFISKRDEFPVMHIKQSKKKRTCQNMNGVLGGSNAFNFLSFVAGVITLVVNVNNNINNNNNNVNGVNANVNNNQNNNANSNSNAANIILAMPGRKKRAFFDSIVNSIKTFHRNVEMNPSCKGFCESHHVVIDHFFVNK